MRKKISMIAIGSMLPFTAMADPVITGELILGYGAIGEDGQSYGIADVNLKDAFDFDNGTKLSYQFGVTLRSDIDDIGLIDDEAIDLSIELDAGTAGKFGLTTFNTIGQKPWADGELFNRGSVNVFPAIRPRYDDVAGLYTNVSGDKVDADVIMTYSNRIGKVGIDVTGNPLRTFDGFDEAEIAGDFAALEAKFTLPTEIGIYSFKANDLDDYLLSVVYPIRSAGVTLIANRQINEADWGDYKQDIVAVWKTDAMGPFKGGMFIHAFDSAQHINMVSANFGGENWELKVGTDTHGDVALEGSYNLADNLKLLAAYDNGHEFTEGFDDARTPPVLAAARDEAWELAVSFSF